MLYPVETGVESIYLAGCCQGPKDVPDTVAQGKAAASSAIFGPTLRECEDELRSTLEDWILVSLKLGYRVPVIANMT